MENSDPLKAEFAPLDIQTKGYPFQNDVCKDSYVRSTVPIHNTSYNLNPNLNLDIYVNANLDFKYDLTPILTFNLNPH